MQTATLYLLNECDLIDSAKWLMKKQDDPI